MRSLILPPSENLMFAPTEASRREPNSRLAFSQVCKSEGKECAMAFLKAAVAWYKRLGIKIERVMTANRSCYRSKVFNKLCEVRGIRHAYTKPSRSKPTAGPSALSSQAYDTSEQRKKELSYWLYHYNWHRPHAGMKGNYRSDVQACM